MNIHHTFLQSTLSINMYIDMHMDMCMDVCTDAFKARTPLHLQRQMIIECSIRVVESLSFVACRSSFVAAAAAAAAATVAAVVRLIIQRMHVFARNVECALHCGGNLWALATDIWIEWVTRINQHRKLFGTIVCLFVFFFFWGGGVPLRAAPDRPRHFKCWFFLSEALLLRTCEHILVVPEANEL